MRIGVSLAVLLLPMIAQAGSDPGIADIDRQQIPSDAVIIDSRPDTQCRAKALLHSKCIPASDLVTAGDELASFRDVLWAFGTAGLSGRETVVVVGDDPVARDFVAGMLYLSGQRHVQVLRGRVSALIDRVGVTTAPGMGRGSLRKPIYRAAMRDDLIVLPAELRRALHDGVETVAVDGRSRIDFQRSSEVRNASGLADVIGYPLQQLRAGSGQGTDRILSGRTRYVAYGYGARDSIALFTRIRAITGADVRVLLGGWRAWLRSEAFASSVQPVSERNQWRRWLYALAVGLVLVACATLIWIGLTTRRNRYGVDVSDHHG